ncbi:MAG: hypothetical protein ACI8XO_002917 [Verrucomicrobiales bacterium]|jgi:uncharacterized protein YacL
MESFSVNLVRGVFLAVCCVLGAIVTVGFELTILPGIIIGFSFAVTLILLDFLLKSFTFREFSHGTIGLMIGLFCAWLILRVDFIEKESIQYVFELALYTALGFFGTTLAMRSDREEFSFIIPYVRFKQDSVQDTPLLVDTNIIIDGRIPRICETGFLSGSIIIPRFILDELHILADSLDPIKSDRGKRGLDGVEQMKNTPELKVAIQEDRMSQEDLIDTKLIQLARRLNARLATNDTNLGKVARLQGVDVLNFNELARAMRPIVSPGDQMELLLVKEGKDPHQAVGYLPDGTMIVVNQAIGKMGENAEVVVAGTLQTSAGRLIFAELKENSKLHLGAYERAAPVEEKVAKAKGGKAHPSKV